MRCSPDVRFAYRTRKAGLAGLLGLALAAGLGGCLRAESTVTIHGDNTYQQTVVITWPNEFAAEVDATAGVQVFETVRTAVLDGAATDQQLPGVDVGPEDYAVIPLQSRDGLQGAKIEVNAVQPISWRADQPRDSDDRSTTEIVREGNQFHVTGYEDYSGVFQAVDDWRAQYPELAHWTGFRVTEVWVFPGPVVKSSGRVEGNKVTFEVPETGQLHYNTVAWAKVPSGVETFLTAVPLWIIITAGTAILAVAAGLVDSVRRRRRSRRAFAAHEAVMSQWRTGADAPTVLGRETQARDPFASQTIPPIPLPAPLSRPVPAPSGTMPSPPPSQEPQVGDSGPDQPPPLMGAPT